MPAEMTNASAVLVAHDMNVSIFKPQWLQRESALAEDELEGNILISPGVVRIPTARFELMVLPDRIQLRPAPESNQAQADLLRVLGTIVSALPHTPFTAIGLNFDYRIHPPADAEFDQWHIARFGAPFPLKRVSEDQGSRFGASFTFDVLGMCLKVEIKPKRSDSSVHNESDDTSEAMVADFNYHRDLAQPAQVSEILGILGSWNDAAEYATKTANAACE